MGEEQKVVVIDTSLAIKWIVYETDSPLAQTLLTEWAMKNVIILAPNLLLYEVANSLYKKVRKDQITFETAIYALNALMGNGLDFEAVTDEKLSQKALEFAHMYKLPATYDAHYLALAEREGCEFWTADERLYNSVKDQLSWVRLLADPAPAALPA